MKAFVAALLALLTFSFSAQAETQRQQEKRYLSSYGWSIGQQASLPALGLSQQELQDFIEGIKLSAKDEAAPADMRSIIPDIEAFLQKKAAAHEAYRQSMSAQEASLNKAKGAAFFEQLRKNPAIKKTETGLFYEVIQAGKPGDKLTPEDIIKVNYQGRLIDGFVFDSSSSRKAPSEFRIKNLIAGFQEGVQLIGEEGKIILYIPSELGYGDNDIPGIPPGSTLIFDVEIVQIEPKDKHDLKFKYGEEATRHMQ